MLNDISGIFQDTNGMGSVEAARMAAEDFNGGGKNIKVEIVYADHQNKADVGTAIARKWLDVEGVDAIVDVPNSAVGLTINSLLRDTRMTFLASSTASSDLTGKACSPNTIQWVNDAWATGNTTAAAMEVITPPGRLASAKAYQSPRNFLDCTTIGIRYRPISKSALDRARK